MSLNALRKEFKGDIVTPADVDYASAIARWAANAERKAGIVAFVRDSADVVLAIQYAKLQKLDIAIRGGGHNSSGASSSDGGLVIDLSRYLNGVRVDPEQRLAYVGGGSLIKAVDEAAMEHGLATVLGTVNHTGVGGFLLGGGYGFLTPAHGLGIDNIVQAVVVVADGSVLTVNDKENSDLFWGIRGAGSNFGVVTELVLKLHPQRATVFCGSIFFPPVLLTQLSLAVEAWWFSCPSEKEHVCQFMTRSSKASKESVIGLTLFYNGSEEEGRNKYKSFFDLQPIVDLCAEIPYEKLNGLRNSYVPHGLNSYNKSVFFEASLKDLTPKVFERWDRENSKIQYDLICDYFPGKMVSSVPKDATAFYHRKTRNIAFCHATWVENTPENLDTARKVSTELMKYFTEANDNPGYANYAGEVVGTASHVQWGENCHRLQQLKRKYDPEQLFNKWFNISPA